MYDLSLTGGDTVWIFMASADGQLDPVLRVYDPGGSMIAENDDSSGHDSLVQMRPATPGVHRIEASGYGSTAGGYTLTVSAIPASAAESSRVVQVDSSRSGTVDSAGDGVDYYLPLMRGETVWITLSTTGNGLDPYLRVYGPDESLIDANDDGSFELNSLVQFTAEVSGVYQVQASGYSDSVGGYTLTLSSTAP